jgi:hypothetical protein
MKVAWAKRIIDSININGAEKDRVTPVPSLLQAVEEAKCEWLMTQNYYDSVSDNDLVDHAVYMMQAAEKKYMYLLKKARNEGVAHTPYP